jgi:glycine cleavage system H lipoate-binding protein/ABC-type phosphate transport system substrate-binding protein
MKRTYFLLISLLLISYFAGSGYSLPVTSNTSSPDSIRILSTPDVYNLSVQWAGEYNKVFPDKKIKVTKVSDEGKLNMLLRKGDIGIVCTEANSALSNETAFKVVIGRDVIVPVINSGNPYLDIISKNGVSPENLTRFLTSPDTRTWGTLLKDKPYSTATYYYIDDESITNIIAGFLKIDKNKITGVKVSNSEEFLNAIKNDRNSIGFCRMVNLFDPKNQILVENVRLLPIDRNGNGNLDYNEKIYDDFNNFSRGIWIGKYPKSLVGNIYSVSSSQPENENEAVFLKWILGDGQKFLYSNGYSDLLISERQTATEKLINPNTYITSATEYKPVFKTILVILAVIILAGIVLDFALRSLRRKKDLQHTGNLVTRSVLNENSLIVPRGLYFDKTHTWAFMEQNGIVKVGIDDFLQHITGKLTRIKMLNEGDKVKKGDPILSVIQNGKQLNLYSPVSGTIRTKNTVLLNDPSFLNTSPYSEGWVYRIEPTNWLRENQLLFMAEKHKLFLKSEFSRLKDFLSTTLNNDSEKFAMAVLQDGGELADSTLANLGPEVWEDFQTKFIDPSRQVWFYELF